MKPISFIYLLLITFISFYLYEIYFYKPMQKVEAQAAFTITTYTDLAGTGASQQVASSGSCRWVQFVSPSANSSNIRIGDSNISATRGTYMAPGSGLLYPYSATGNGVFLLSKLYALIQSGDNLSITCGS
jgi:hypothetical protein